MQDITYNIEYIYIYIYTYIYNISDAGAVDREFFVFLLMYFGVLFWGLTTPLIHCAQRFPAVRRNRKRMDMCPKENTPVSWSSNGHAPLNKPKHKKQRASMDVEMDTTVFSATFKLARAYWGTYTRQQRWQCFFLGLLGSKPYVS